MVIGGKNIKVEIEDGHARIIELDPIIFWKGNYNKEICGCRVRHTDSFPSYNGTKFNLTTSNSWFSINNSLLYNFMELIEELNKEKINTDIIGQSGLLLVQCDKQSGRARIIEQNMDIFNSDFRDRIDSTIVESCVHPQYTGEYFFLRGSAKNMDFHNFDYSTSLDKLISDICEKYQFMIQYWRVYG